MPPRLLGVPLDTKGTRLVQMSAHEPHILDETEESVPAAEEQRDHALIGTVSTPTIPLEIQRTIAMWTGEQHRIVLRQIVVRESCDALRAPTFFFVDAPDVSAGRTGDADPQCLRSLHW